MSVREYDCRGGSGGGGFKPEGRPQRFDKGPQIDTWTNETAENADKEPAGVFRLLMTINLCIGILEVSI